MNTFTHALKSLTGLTIVLLAACAVADDTRVADEPGLFRTNPETNVVEYLLVSPPEFYDDWCWYVGERQKVHPHLRFAVKNTAAIYDAYPFATNRPCRNAAESLHAYLRTAVTNGLQYVVLGGAWLDAQNLNNRTTYFANGETMSLSNCVPGIYSFPREEWRQIPSDLFYACLTLASGETHPWDANGDGKYIDQADCKNNNLYPNVCVSRITLNPYNTTSTPYNPHALITNYVAKLARGEAKDFAGHYRYGMSAASTGNSKLRKTGDRMYYRELEFYDGMRNMFDPLHHDSLEDDEYSVRVRTFDQYSMWRPVRSVKGMMNYTWTGRLPTLAAAMDDYYAADRDFAYVQAHGWAQGAAQFSAQRFSTATGLTLFNGGSGPCETGYPDYYVTSNGKNTLQFNVGDAAVTNPHGGALASVNNSRWSWAGGGGYAAMSYYMLNEILIGFNQERKDVGHAWLRGVRNYWPAAHTGSTPTWCLVEQFLYGDPLVQLPEVPNVWWTGGETGTWDRVTACWTNNVDATTTFDAASNVYFSVQKKLTLDVSDEIAAMYLSLPAQEEDAVLTLAGTGSLRVLQALDVTGTNPTLRLGVAGGVGHQGIRFQSDAGNLVFTGTNKFYVGGITNARAVTLQGGGVTLDVDEFPAGNFPLVFDGRNEPTLPIPNILRSKNVGGLTRFGPLALTNTYVQLSSVDAFGTGAPATHTLVDSTLEIGANVYYQRSGYLEGLNATFLVDGHSAVTSSLGGLWTVKHTTTFALGTDAHLTLGADTAAANGRIVITNALPDAVSNSVTIAHANSLAGDVRIGKGLRLALKDLPLTAVTSLTIEEDATVELPDSTSGYWQLVPVSSHFTCASNVTFTTASAPTNKLAGSASLTGSFFQQGALYEWTGREGDWDTFFANRHPKILFGDLDANDATVRVATAVSPDFTFFANLRTHYAFAPASDDASILFSSIFFCGPTTFDVPVAATEYVEVTTGTTRFSCVQAPYVHVAAGAGIVLAGSHWTDFRLDANALLVAAPHATLDWNAETTITFPDHGTVRVDVGALALSDTPTPLITGRGHTWTLADLQHLTLVQTNAEFRIVDGTLCVVRGNGLKGPYALTLAGAGTWNTNAWTADGTNRVPFTAAWADLATDWSTDATVTATANATLAVDCDVHVTTLTIRAATNDFTLAASDAFRALDVATLDLSDCRATTDIAVDTNDAEILTPTNETAVIHLRGTVAGTLTLSGPTVVLDHPGDLTLATGAQGTLRIVATQAYERFRVAQVANGFELGGLTIEVIDRTGRAHSGFTTSVSDGALWCHPPAILAEVLPGTNDLTQLVWQDVLGNVVPNVDWTAATGFQLIGTPTSGVVIAKSGFASVWSSLSVSNEVAIYGNETLSPAQIPSGNGVLALEGGFTLKADVNASQQLLNGAKLKLGTGSTLEIRHLAKHYNATSQDWSGISGTGTIRFVDASSSWLALPSGIFASTLSVTSDSDIVLTEGFGETNPFGVRNLAGTGLFRSDWSTGASVRPVRTVQTRVTAFSGALYKQDSKRTAKLVVASDDAIATTNKALILNGTAVEEHTLDIETNGCVILTGTWQGPINVAGILVITNACTTNGLAVTIAPGGSVQLLGAADLPDVTALPDYVAPTYPDDPVTPVEPAPPDTRIRDVVATVAAGNATWSQLNWCDTNGVALASVDWASITNATLIATNGAARVIFDATEFTNIVHLVGTITVETHTRQPFMLAVDSVGAVDFRLSPEPSATCDLLVLTSAARTPTNLTVTAHNRYGRNLDGTGEVAYEATAGKYYLNVQNIDNPTYSCTFDTKYEDTLTSALWFNGSGNLTYAAKPELFEDSRDGRALKGTAASSGFVMYSHNGCQTYSVDDMTAVTLSLVAKLPSNNLGTLIALGSKHSGNGLALARVSANVAGVYVWENAGAVRLVASASVPFAGEQFHAYAVTHDGETLRFYVDGTLVHSTALVGRYPSTGYYQWFNVYGGGGLSSGTSSVVDDFRLYLNTCLTATSVRKLADAFPPWPEHPSAEVDVADLAWTNLYWSAEYATDEALTLVGGAGSLRFDEATVVSNALAVTGGTVPLTLTGDGALIVPNGLAIASALVIDAGGLDGTNLARRAVAGAPYSRWLVRGPVTGNVTVENLPSVPAAYTIAAETVPTHGVRLVVTANRAVRFGAISVNLSGNGYTVASEATKHGAYPVAGTGWNNIRPNSATTTAALTGVTADGSVTNLTTTFTNASAKEYDTKVNGTLAILRGYHDDGSPSEFTLTGIPFEQYRLIVYYATDTANYGFAGMIAGISATETNGYHGAAYPSTTGGATLPGAAGTVWGSSNVRATLAEGVNYLVSDVLTGGDAYIKSVRDTSTKGRATIAAIQVVKVGEVYAGEPEEEGTVLATKLSYVLPGTTITQAFDYVYHPLKTDDHLWATAANWATAEIVQYTNGVVVTNYTPNANAVAPALANGSFVPVVFDGAVVMGAVVEGWVAQYGLYHGSDVTIETQNKFQSEGSPAMFVAVDETSRLTIANWGNASFNNSVNFYLAAPSGLVVKAAYAKSTAFDYYLTGKGSAYFANGFSGTHRLRAATIEQGDAHGVARRILKKYLVIGDGTVTTDSATVTGGDDRKTDDAELSTDDPVGTYRISRDTTGTFIEWVARKHATVIFIN